MTRNPEGARPDPRDHSNLPVLRDAAHREMVVYDPYLNAQLPDDEIDLREIWRIIAKYRWTIIVFAALVVITVGVANVLMRPVYKATTTVEIAPDSNVVKLENIEDTQRTSYREFAQTQEKIGRAHV